jgi:MFS family permease
VNLAPLRTSREFRLYFAGSTVTLFGSMITFVALPWQVARLTGSPLVVGLLGTAELVPLLVTAFVGGALADYFDRRLLVRVTEAGFAVATGLLVLNATLPHPRVWVLFALSVVLATLDGMQRPALDSMLPRLVPAEQIPAATALSSLRFNIGGLAGPALAGVLLASVALPWVYAIDLATFVFSLTTLALMRTVPPPPDAERPSLRTIAEGFRYATSRAELMGTYLVDINAMLFGMPMALFPFLAEHLGGPKVLGLLYAAPAAGSLLVTLTSGWTGRVRRHGLMVVIAAAVWGAAIAAFGFCTEIWLAVLFLAIAGGADMLSGLFRSYIWQQTIPDHLRGRLAGIEMLSYASGPMLGNAESGLAASAFSVRTSVVSGGVLCVLGTGLLALALPSFLRYDSRTGSNHKQRIDAERAAREGEHR